MTDLIDHSNRIVNDIGVHKTDKYEQMLYNKLTILKDEVQEIVLAGQLAKRRIVNSNLLSAEEVKDVLSPDR